MKSRLYAIFIRARSANHSLVTRNLGALFARMKIADQRVGRGKVPTGDFIRGTRAAALTKG